MSDEISTIILTESEQTKDVMTLYLQEFGKFTLLEDISDLSEIFNVLSSMPKSLLLVDLSVNSQKYIDLVQNLSVACSGCKIVAISDSPSVELIVRAMRAGAKEFLSAPIIKSEFFDVLSKAQAYFSENKPKVNKCRVLSIFSNKGGIGKTSIASNLALELARITKENVALVDLNFQAGDITSFLDLKPSFNISYNVSLWVIVSFSFYMSGKSFNSISFSTQVYFDT